MSELTPIADWAASGAMALTGRPSGPPLAAPGTAATLIRHTLERIADLTRERTGVTPGLPGIELLGERAAVAGLARRGPWSCGGAFRTLPTADGWWGLSLPRPDDMALVPALIEAEVDGAPWEVVARWAAETTTDAAVARSRLLGLACAPVRPPTQSGHTPSSSELSESGDRAPVLIREGGRRPRLRGRPRVVDLTCLWAGPLCAHLLGLGDADVVKVESIARPDGARAGPAAFFDCLHVGHPMVALDFQDRGDLARLADLVGDADLVLESSRPRALRQLGLDSDAFVDAGTSWLSITGYGRDRNVIGFGDDVASGAGHVVWDEGEPLPCGDALADPLAGVCAAEAAAETLLADRARLIDVSMHHVARGAATGAAEPHDVFRERGRWWVECATGRYPVVEPSARRPAGRAGRIGADNAEVLR